jgi:hypothetical protein
MLINRNRKLSDFMLLLLTALVVNSCAADKKSVDPYPDDSYTSSVARTRSGEAGTAPISDGPGQEGSAVLAPGPDQSPPPEAVSSKALLPLLTLVDDRIVAYERKVEQWNTIIAEAATAKLDVEQQDTLADCRNRLTGILNGYNDLHQRLISGKDGQIADGYITEQFLATERQDLNFLESPCQQIFMSGQQTGGWVGGARDRLLELEEKERELQEKMASGEYQQVVELYLRLPLEEGQPPSYAASYAYGQALLRTGRESDAAQVFQELLVGLQEQNQIEREFKLMQLIADIQFGMENFDRAFERYIDIINRYAGLGENIDWARKQQSVISVRNTRMVEVKNFAELMRSYLTYNADRDGFKVFLLATRYMQDFPASTMLPTVNHILSESRDRAEAWFALVLQRINVLKEESRYQDVLQFIEQLPVHEMPVDKMQLLHSMRDELVAVNTEEQEARRLEVEETMQEIWSTGQNYLQEKEYDQAIETFSTLLETEYADRATDKIAEASQLAAQEDRRRAAELFVLSGKTDDRENRTDLLLQSRQLLKGILEKYPQSGLLEKTEKNLERIEAELRSIDPALLTEPEAAAVPRQSLQNPTHATDNNIPLGQGEKQVRPVFPNE